MNNLKAPDLISVEEVQDNNGTTNNGTVDATTTWNALIATITAAGGLTYQYTQIDPVNNQDGAARVATSAKASSTAWTAASPSPAPGRNLDHAELQLCHRAAPELQPRPHRP